MRDLVLLDSAGETRRRVRPATESARVISLAAVRAVRVLEQASDPGAAERDVSKRSGAHPRAAARALRLG
ncbi:MAG: hypothetical protein QOC82_1549 [Frankiaceae bacterium]|jgi:hypothetical protein|nr:hypothetical protein [Frankiaceae bacterium]